MRTLLALFFVACTFPFEVQSSSQTNGVSLSAMEAAFSERDFLLAKSVATTILDIDHEHFRSLYVVAAASIEQGDFSAALDFAGRALSAAANDEERLKASSLLALVHFKSKNYLLAKYWLRSAMNNTADPAQLDRLRREFALVRAKSPWSVELSFGVAPNSNINNGSSAKTITISGLPFTLNADARAIAGIEIQSGLDLRFKFADDGSSKSVVGIQAFGRTYQISDRASKEVPDAHGYDYAFAMIQASLDHTRSLPGMSGPSGFGLVIGESWYGGSPYANHFRASLSQDFVIGTDERWRVSASSEWQSVYNDGRHNQIGTLEGSYLRRFNRRSSIQLNAIYKQTTSSDVQVSSQSKGASIGYSLGIPVLDTDFTVALKGVEDSYDHSKYSSTGRTDIKWTISVGSTFKSVSFFGFSPTISIEATNVDSDVELFDRETLTVQFGYRSIF